MRLPVAAALALAACRPLPEHLRLDPGPVAPDSARPTVKVTDRASAVAALVGADPLARNPVFTADPAGLSAIPGAEAVHRFVDTLREVETARAPLGRAMSELEAELPQTEAVALSRGYRLKVAENQLLNTLLAPRDAEREVTSLLSPLRLGVDDPGNARMPLDFLRGDGAGAQGITDYGERWVALGWMAGPEVPVSALLAPLAAPQYDALRARPVGRLLVARGEGRRSEGGDAAFADLVRATHLALVRAAADRDAEQGAWADERRRVAAELGVDDPVTRLLERAFDGLTADAGDPRSAGGALVALTALRWLGKCGDPPCTGLDRAETLNRARAWHPDLVPLADTWDVAQWDQTLATLHSGRDTGLFPTVVVDLADLLVGTGGPVDAAILTKIRPDPTVWMIAARAVGVEGAIDWEGAHVALGKHLERVARDAATRASPEDRALLERIASRAVP